MHLYDVVLFLHIFIAIAAFGCAILLHTMQFILRRATDAGQIRLPVTIVHRVEPLFPVLALVLFALGAWLIGIDSSGEIKWSDGWVISAIVGLALMEILGGVVLAPRGKALHAAAEAATAGPVDAQLRGKIMDPLFWAVSFFETSTALGILFVMPTKPSGLASGLIVGLAAMAGLALGAALGRDPAPTATQQPAPAGSAA